MFLWVSFAQRDLILGADWGPGGINNMKKKKLVLGLVMSCGMAFAAAAVLVSANGMKEVKAGATGTPVLVGNFSGGGWDDASGIAFTLADGKYSVTRSLVAGDEFKIKQTGTWDGAIGASGLTRDYSAWFEGSDNAKVKSGMGGDFTFTFDKTNWETYDDLSYALTVTRTESTAHTVTVHYYHNGVDDSQLTHNVSVEDGEALADAELFGYEFLGYWDNYMFAGSALDVSHITADMTVYANFSSLATAIDYTIDASAVASIWNTDYIYAHYWSTTDGTTWPGILVSNGTDVTIAGDAAGLVLSDEDGHQTSDIALDGIHTQIVVKNETTGTGKYMAELVVATDSYPDKPLGKSDYVILGDSDDATSVLNGMDWLKANAVYLDAGNSGTTDLGKLENVHLVKDEVFQIKLPGNDAYAPTVTYPEGQNHFATAAGLYGGTDITVNDTGDYDIYVNSEGNLYIREHVSTYTATIKASDGSAVVASLEDKVFTIYSDGVYNPAAAWDGYDVLGYFTDVTCLTPYVAAAPTADLTLYAKVSLTDAFPADVTGVAYALIGHGEAGSALEACNWTKAGSLQLSTSTGNVGAALNVALKAGDEFKIVSRDGTNTYFGATQLGASYAWAEASAAYDHDGDPTTTDDIYSDDNILMKTNGVYNIYFNDGKIYMVDTSTIDYRLMGSSAALGGWNAESAPHLWANAFNDKEYMIMGITVAAGDKFKVFDAASNAYYGMSEVDTTSSAYASLDVADADDNIVVKSDDVIAVFFNVDTHAIFVQAEEEAEADQSSQFFLDVVQCTETSYSFKNGITWGTADDVATYGQAAPGAGQDGNTLVYMFSAELAPEALTIFKNATAKVDGSFVEKAVARYDRMVAKYGFYDFLGRGIGGGAYRSSNTIGDAARNYVAYIAAGAAIAVIAAGTIIFLKKRKAE